MTLGELEARFANVSVERTHHRDQQLGTLACREALAAAGMGTTGWAQCSLIRTGK